MIFLKITVEKTFISFRCIKVYNYSIILHFSRKQCILSESRFDFLKDLVKSLPDVSPCDEEGPSLSSICDKIPPHVPLERLV